MVTGAPRYQLFLISPANLAGVRGQLISNPAARFPLAEELRSPAGAPLGKVFSFVSGLYFRGKMAYAEAFGRAPEGLSPGLVISPAEGLRFLYEPVTIERLRAWAEVPIDEDNPSYTRPLIEHARALAQTFGDDARFVLLGSVATDKYVKPLTEVFGDRLAFPPDFRGRGDMSRGALMLDAARTGVELAYAPIAGADRHGARPARIAQTRRNARASAPRAAPPAADAPQVVLLIGLPGAGKSTFYQQRFAATHVHVSRDLARRAREPEARQTERFHEALRAGKSVVVDNTNVSIKDRAPWIEAARRLGARVTVYLFTADARECVGRNAGREGAARVPNVGIYAAARRLVRPGYEEGFDELYCVRTLPELTFELEPPEDP